MHFIDSEEVLVGLKQDELKMLRRILLSVQQGEVFKVSLFNKETFNQLFTGINAAEDSAYFGNCQNCRNFESD